MSLTSNLNQVTFFTGENYQKKYLSDKYETALNLGNLWEHTQVIFHDLDYIPNAKVWIEQDGDGRIRMPSPINSIKETVVVVKPYSDRVEVTCSSPTSANDVALNVYYEIYLDADDTGETDISYFSKYAIDRVYKVLEGSFLVGAGATVITSVAHGQSKPLLPKAIWSYDGTNWYSVRNYYDPTSVSNSFTGELDVGSANVNIYASNSLGVPKTFYYKIALTEPEVNYPAGYTTSGIALDTRKDTFKNFESLPKTVTLSGNIASHAIKTFSTTLTNSMGLNISDFYFRKSTDAFFYNGYVGAGTGLISVPVSGGATVTDIPVEFFLVTANGTTTVVMWMFNPDINTVMLASTNIDLRLILYASPFSS